MKDRQLQQDVIDELDFDPTIQSEDIGVVAEGSVVTLSGHVPSFAHKHAAEAAAWRVKGVKAVAQEIEVRFPEDKKTNDDEIAKRALDILSWDSMLPRDAIRVKVQDGWVTLTGNVDWNYQRDLAQTDVRRLGGVAGVTCQIGLNERARPEDVEHRIADALRRHAQCEADRVKVHVRDKGTVTLEGDVDTWDERQAVVHAAWCASGVQQVEDRLRIR